MHALGQLGNSTPRLPMLFRRRRHRRWIALIALLGLLFQQLAMATYICPLDGGRAATAAATSDVAHCQPPGPTDKTRCEQHCHPLAQSSDHAPALTVPPALPPATTWSREFQSVTIHLSNRIARDVDARATAPPLTIQHCTFQI